MSSYQDENTINGSYVKLDSTRLGKGIKLFDEVDYWKIIQESLAHSSSQRQQEMFLINTLEKMPPEEIIAFELRTCKLIKDSYLSNLWCAAYLINGGCSDDCFEYFRRWLISRGEKTYKASIKNPDYLITEGKLLHGESEFEEFMYVSGTAFKRRTGKDIYEYIDNKMILGLIGSYSKLEPTWQENNPESMKKICPKLFSKYARW